MKLDNTNRTALIPYRPLSLQVVLPLGGLTKPELSERIRNEVIAAVARLLLEAAGATKGGEADDDRA